MNRGCIEACNHDVIRYVRFLSPYSIRTRFYEVFIQKHARLSVLKDVVASSRLVRSLCILAKGFM